MIDHIAKPINPDQMFRCMAQWIKPSLETSSKHLQATAKSLENIDFTFPETAGINVKEGLQHCQNNAALYRSLLVRFAHVQDSFMTQFESAKLDDDSSSAQRCAHSLKGNAGSIGLLDVQLAAQKLEHACKFNDDSNEIDNLAKVVDTALKRAIPEIFKFETSTVVPTSEKGEGGHIAITRVIDTLNELKPLIQNCDAEALEIASELSRQTAKESYGDDLTKLVGALESFDFDSADKIIDLILAEHQ